MLTAMPGKSLLFRYTLGQSAAWSLQGLDALDLLVRYHPAATDPLTLHPALSKQAGQVVGMIVQYLGRFRHRQRSVHQTTPSIALPSHYSLCRVGCRVPAHTSEH